jgi:hypothetical protein
MNPLQLRVRKSYLIRGVLCAIGFAAIGTLSVLPASLNIDGSVPHPIRMAFVFGIFWGAWFVLSLYTIAASCREKLTVTSQFITQEGVFRTRTTAVPDISSVKWRAWPIGGSIVIRYSHSRIKIHFDNYLAHEREQLISALRELISKDCQDNWDVFVSSQHPEPTRPLKTRSIAIVCMAMFSIVAAVFLYCWHIHLGLRFLVVGVGCALVGLWYLIRILKFVPDSKSDLTA